MADLIQNWLNNEIELSKPVENFEKDFANGYLFGELLYKFNQQSNFKEFSNKENVTSKMENFQKLDITLRNLKIKFNSAMIDQIMKGERGIALRLLYQLRMALEKVYPPTDIAVLRKTGKMGDNQPALKIAPSKEKYDAHAHVFFQQRLQVLNKPQKMLNMEKHLEKFENEKDRQASEAQKYHKEQLQAEFKVKQEIRAASINKLQRNAGFMEEWLQKGVEDWKKNQSIKKDRERRELEFEYKQTGKFNEMTMRKVNGANQEVNDGIENFEKTLKSIGINPHVKKNEAERAVSESFQNSPGKSTSKMHKMSQSLINSKPAQAMTGKMGGITLTSTGLKGKDKKTITDNNRKGREYRMTMIVDQSKTLFEMDQKRREAQIVERMKRQAKQEVELGYEEWRTRQCSNIITENRKLREARYEKRRELDQQNSNWREQEMIKSLEDQINREMEVLQERDREMRIVHKQAKREGRSNFAADLFDQIFEVANQAYIHQQKCDSQEIDERNWHEWMQLFVEQLPIAPQQQKSEQVKAQEESEMDLDQQQIAEDPNAEVNLKLDHMELVDYLENKGQWPTSLLSEFKVNVEQVLTGQGDQPGAGAGAPAGKGAKAPAAKVQVEQIQLEEGDTEVSETAPNNYILGDALETVIHINFEEREKCKRPLIPHHLSLKVCFIGYQFTGKKAQAERLRQEYGLQSIQMSDLIQEAIQFSLAHPDPIELLKQSPTIEEEQTYEDGIDTRSEPDLEGSNPEEDLRVCGLEIQDILGMGQEISDEIYVRLFVAKLRMTFPYKSKKELYGESRLKVLKSRYLKKQLDDIERQINGETLTDPHTGKRLKKRSPTELSQEKTQLEAQISALSQIPQEGWILLDFPTSFAQAKLLEQALSGFFAKPEQELTRREIEVSEAGLLVKSTDKEVPPVQLIKSGLDSVIWFDAGIDACLNRAVGRRFDQTNEKMFHIFQQPPLTTNAPLCERLVPMDEEFNSEATLIDRWIAFDAHSKSLENWLSQFGDYETQRCILNKIDANGSEEETYAQIKQVFDEIIRVKQEKENQLREVEITNKLNEAEEIERERLQKIAEEEAERKRIEEEGIQPESKEEQKKENKVEKPGPVTERIGLKPPHVSNIDNDVKGTLHKLWETISKNYKSQMKKSFRGVRGQRERLIERFAHIQKQFLHFLHRPDAKQEKLEQFIKDFNDFSDAYPDLREDDQTKEELHERTDRLSDELWEIIEERKDQEVEERKKIMESGWIEFELSFLVQCAQQIMQSEVDRFKGSIQLIHDYYHLFEDKLIPETPPQVTTEIGHEGDELIPIELLGEGQDLFNIDNYTYPRLDKLFERALKAQVVPDVTQIQASTQDKKGAPAKGKDPKKPAQEEEKPLEESIYVKEMKKAIKVEKSLLRFRLIQVRNWTLKRLKEMRQKCLKVYQKLDDWILVAVKSENDAVDEMCVVIKKAIEEESKIQDELRIKFMDFCVDEKVMNFIIPPPEKLPALEQLKPTRFTIPQLRSMVSELDRLSHDLGNWPNIPNKVVIDLLVRKHENSKSLGDENGLPEEWKNFSEYDFQTMVRNLDKYCHGVISWKLLATCMSLLKSLIPTDKEADAYQQALVKVTGKEMLIDEQSFVKVPAWFDSEEHSEDRDYSIPFPRVRFIKQLLFSVNKEEKNGVVVLNVKKLLTVLKAKEITMFKKSVKTYEDILMTPVEK